MLDWVPRRAREFAGMLGTMTGLKGNLEKTPRRRAPLRRLSWSDLSCFSLLNQRERLFAVPAGKDKERTKLWEEEEG